MNFCSECGGSGLRVDAIERTGAVLSDRSRDALGETACHECNGSGRPVPPQELLRFAREGLRRAS